MVQCVYLALETPITSVAICFFLFSKDIAAVESKIVGSLFQSNGLLCASVVTCC